ncbi:MAG TPA: peroxiredoxin, partial [Polyangiaceae bacterium]|nr:peroxiredoxin [Polyangiaceae bacterium]
MTRARKPLWLLFSLLSLAACNKREPAATASPSSAPLASAGESPGSTLLAVGAPAPELEAVAQNGQKVKLSELRGKPVVVYFYPKDNTTGCTIEAEEIRDLYGAIAGVGAVVIGVSTDDEASHKEFA